MNNPDTDDLTMVGHLLADPPPPAPGVVASAQAALEGAMRDEVTPRRTRRPVAVAAAAVLVAGGAAYGLTAGLGGSSPATTTPSTAALTAVKGCFPLVTALGTLVHQHGTSLVVHTQSGGQATINAAPGTAITVLDAPPSSITDGEPAIVAGTESHGTIAAGSVSAGGVSPEFSYLQGRAKVVVQGTVTGASGSGFTLITRAGRRFPVTLSSRTQITDQDASLRLLRPGMEILGIGRPGAGGSLAASVISQVSLPPFHVHVQVVRPRGCSPTDIALAYTGGTP